MERLVAAVVISLVVITLGACGGTKSANQTTTTSTAPTSGPEPARTTSTTSPLDPSKPFYGYASCADAAANVKFIFANSASEASGTVTASGSNANLVCGGPDDSHFEPTTPLSISLPSSSTVSVLKSDAGSEVHQVTAAELPHVVSTTSQHYFVIIGDIPNPTSLYQAWHP